MASAYPGTQIDTKINYLVDLANQAYINSKLIPDLRIVKTQQVSYTDGGLVLTAINELIDGTGVFSNVANWRDTYGADVVTLLRKHQTSNDSCAWRRCWLPIISVRFFLLPHMHFPWCRKDQ